MFQQTDEFSVRDREDKAKMAAMKGGTGSGTLILSGANTFAGGKETDMKQEQTKSLSTARGNRQQQIEQAQAIANADVKQQPARPMSEARPPGTPSQAMENRPDSNTISTNTIVALLPSVPLTVREPGVPNAPAARAGTAQANDPQPTSGAPATDGVPSLQTHLSGLKKSAVQPLGRLSLAVDFPTQGHVHHFQKAKASAVLEIFVADPALARQWMRLAIFAGMALLLALGGRLAASRRVRRGA